ncbi:hypothetical protein SUGI_0446200 [Cryptomeria japonica]|nr:hypothetical protein SUGI_0446200 [Cryptomeria japonica]
MLQPLSVRDDSIMGSQRQEVYVAVGKDPLRSISTLQWTLNNKSDDSLVLLHVQLPMRTVPSPLGKIPVNQICSEAKVKARALIVKKADIRRGIVEIVRFQSWVSGSLS